MKRVFLIFIFFDVFLAAVYGQQIRIIDGTTLNPVPIVGIFNLDRTKFTKSDDNGMADLSVFQNGELIEFQHPSYKNLVISVDEAIKKGTIQLVDEIIKINEIVISANKWSQGTSEVPNSIVSIQQKDIDFNNPQTAADALEISGQVFVQKSQLGGGSPMIRGFAANSVLIAVDGVRMNNAIFRSGNLQNVINIDPNILDNIEVVMGPGSVIYGSDALGGVMNFNTRQPVFSFTDNPLFKGSGYIRYSSADNENTGHLNFNLAGNKISWLSGFTFSNFNDLKTGRKRTEKFPDYGKRPEYVANEGGEDVVVINPDENLQVYSGYKAWNTVQKFRFSTSDSYDMTYSFYYSTTSDIPRYDRLIEYKNGQLASAEWYYGPQIWMMNSLELSVFSPSTLYSKMRIILANQKFEESRNDRGFMKKELRKRTENVNVWTLNLDLEKDWEGGSQLFYGFELADNKVDSNAESHNIDTGETGPASTRYPDGGSRMTTFAGYGSYKLNVDKRNIISAGIRYSYSLLNSLFEDTTFYDFPFDQITLKNGSLTGNAGYVYHSPSHWKLDFLVSSGFRSPNVDDVGKVFDSGPGIVVVPNENLGPEYAVNGEATITKVIQGRFSISVNGFYTRLIDAMERRDFTFNGQDSIIYDETQSKVEAVVNIGKAHIYGGSADIKIDFNDHINLTSTLTVMNGEDIIENIPLRHTTPLFGRTGVIIRGGKYRIDVYANYQGAKSFEDLAPTEQDKVFLYTTDGALAWTTFNIKGSYQPFPYLQLSSGIENITDIHYRPYSSGISAPGRNFIFTVKGNF